MTTIDETKFASLSAELLVRKGDAAPSDIRRPRRRKSDGPTLSLVASNPELPSQAERWDDQPAPDEDSELLVPYGVFDRTLNQSAPKKQHRLMIALSEEEYETLGILAVKKGFTRHQVLRKALDGYLEWLVDEFGPRCRCIASTCSNECDHLTAAEMSERPMDVE